MIGPPRLTGKGESDSSDWLEGVPDRPAVTLSPSAGVVAGGVRLHRDPGVRGRSEVEPSVVLTMEGDFKRSEDGDSGSSPSSLDALPKSMMSTFGDSLLPLTSISGSSKSPMLSPPMFSSANTAGYQRLTFPCFLV